MYLGPPLQKLLGLLELLSKLWNTIFPDEFILGLSTETPLLAAAETAALRRTGLRPDRTAAPSAGGRGFAVLLGFRRSAIAGGLSGKSREWRGISSWSWPEEEEEERESRDEEIERDSKPSEEDESLEVSNGRTRDEESECDFELR